MLYKICQKGLIMAFLCSANEVTPYSCLCKSVTVIPSVSDAIMKDKMLCNVSKDAE